MSRIRWAGVGCLLALSGVSASAASAAPPPGEVQRVLDVMSPARAGGGTAGQVGVLVRQVSATRSTVPATPVLASGEHVRYEPASSVKTILGVVAENSVSPSSSVANPAVVAYSYPKSPNSSMPNSPYLCPVKGDETPANQRPGITLRKAQADMLQISDNPMTRALLLRAGGWDAALAHVGARASMPNTVLTQDFVGCAHSLGKTNRTTLSDMSNLYAAIDAPGAGLLNQTRRDDLYSTMPWGYSNGRGPFPDVVADEAAKLQLTSSQLSTFNEYSFLTFKAGSYNQPCTVQGIFDLPPACTTVAFDQYEVDLSYSGLQRLGFMLTDGSIDTRTYTVGAYTFGRLCASGACYIPAADQTTIAAQAESIRSLIRDSMLSIKYPRDPAPTAAFTHTAPAGSLSAQFDAAGSIDPGGTVSAYAWDFGDGSTGAGATASHTYSAPGSYAVTLWVADGVGKSDAIRKTVVVGATPDPEPTATPEPTTTPEPSATPAPLPGPGGPSEPTLDRTAPKLSFSLPQTLRRGQTARVRTTVDSPATLRLVLTRPTAGRLVRGKCVAQTRGTRTARRCTRAVTLATVSRQVPAGSTTVALPRTSSLPRGRYTLTVTATDAAGNVSSPRALKLTVK